MRLGGLGILGGVTGGVCKEARTRAFACRSFGGFGVVYCGFFIRLAAAQNLIVKTIGLFKRAGRSAIGRNLPFISVVFLVPERPLPVKADVQILTLEISLPSDQYTSVSGP
jgi:hypothetical protein